MHNYILCINFLFISVFNICFADTVEYDLTFSYRTFDFTGKKVVGMAVNGGIPAPTLYFKVGDVAHISVSNQMDEETSVHCHGILLPNHQDGVPYINHPPIKPGETHLFEFPITHAGTYWYHSHSGLQEQQGIYGAIVIAPKNLGVTRHTQDKVLVFSDWSNESADEIMRTLKSGSEFYSIQKNSKQNLYSAFRHNALSNTLQQSWQRMPGMDISDVAYDAFLVNGKKQLHIAAQAGERIRLRLINAGASTYFNLQYAGGSMQIISADGVDVQPAPMQKFLMAVAETYDVVVKVPDKGRYELRASAQDGSGYTSIWIGQGRTYHSAPDYKKPNPYQSESHNAHGREHHSHAHMQDNFQPEVTETPYTKLRATRSTSLPKNNQHREITLNLTGDMERYVWSIDNEIIAADNSIKIKRGENIRFILNNKTMMHHPMHLHGHFFRVINQFGDYSPLKHTVDVPPMGQRIIEFAANEFHDWFFHCHILYHVKSGMGRLVSYQEDKMDPEISSIRDQLYQDEFYAYAYAALLSQMTDGIAVFRNSKNSLELRWETGWQNEPEVEYEVELTLERYFNRYLSGFAGVDFINEEQRGIFGLRYLLPFNIESEWRIDTKAEFRVSVEKFFQLTNTIDFFTEFEYDTEKKQEWVLGIHYSWQRNVGLMAQYHSEFGMGAGIKIAY